MNRRKHRTALRALGRGWIIGIVLLFSLAYVAEAKASSDVDLLTVRVVVHVVYQQEAQNISDEQVRSQLRVLNEDFQRKNPNASQTLAQFQPLAANARIAFVLARADPEGRPTNGITRTATTHGPFANNDIHQSRRGGQDAWNPARYFNVWVCALAPGTLGYAVLPDDTSGYDGVVVDYRHFGAAGTVRKPYHLGRTLTHETGHWLGLHHPWGNRGGCDDDDGIDDTPPQVGSYATYDAQATSCGSPDMVQNFMNLAPDSLLTFFTHQQAERMHRTLREQRSGVLDEDYVLALPSPLIDRSFRVFPDAVQPGLVHVVSSAPAMRWYLEVSNATGQTIQRSASVRSRRTVDLRPYAPGVYFFRTATPEARMTLRVIHP